MAAYEGPHSEGVGTARSIVAMSLDSTRVVVVGVVM